MDICNSIDVFVRSDSKDLRTIINEHFPKIELGYATLYSVQVIGIEIGNNQYISVDGELAQEENVLDAYVPTTAYRGGLLFEGNCLVASIDVDFKITNHIGTGFVLRVALIR